MIVDFRHAMIDYIENYLIESGENLHSLWDLGASLASISVRDLTEVFELAKNKQTNLSSIIRQFYEKTNSKTTTISKKSV